jgi:hypothetical protein
MEGEVKGALDKLAERIDKLLVVLNQIAEDLREVLISLKSSAVSQITQPPTASPAPTPTAQVPETWSIEEIETTFPEDLRALLGFEDKGDYVEIKPRRFLGSENFAKIADIVKKQFDGDYISAGRDSHFRIPKKRR